MLDLTVIFVANNEEQSLMVFPPEADAVAYCEGLDVEAGEWLFWDNAGNPLEPRFEVPNKRGLFTVQNGTYRLVPAASPYRVELAVALSEIRHFEGPALFLSEAVVRNHIAVSSIRHDVSPGEIQLCVQADRGERP
ncbi:hypothetical protein [Chiayiivirga flava]|uniref:Uncharacterized protein n=1 Tax=Chiayiivirga flava TaxID=659595 RepID=A0A7W8D712_9GAMM|nr:hypothetical protein [Chiayiivirga flava]MBB5207871.1 hypothetical protein [Chiayiivirga flava]